MHLVIIILYFYIRETVIGLFLPADLEKRQAKHPSKCEHSALAYGYAHRVAEGAD